MEILQRLPKSNLIVSVAEFKWHQHVRVTRKLVRHNIGCCRGKRENCLIIMPQSWIIKGEKTKCRIFNFVLTFQNTSLANCWTNTFWLNAPIIDCAKPTQLNWIIIQIIQFWTAGPSVGAPQLFAQIDVIDNNYI